MKINEKYVVSVVVLCYNQEKYIRQTLDSILSQKTDYIYEIIVGDDCSNDGSRDILKEYESKYSNIVVLYNDYNLGIIHNWLNCAMRGTGKYIMSCDGDDYWHNPYKIQLQVDYMEQHPECVTCHTDIDILHNNTGRIEHNVHQAAGYHIPTGMIQQEVIRGCHHIESVAFCHRRETFEKYIPVSEFIRLEIPCQDWSVFFILSAYGEVGYIPVSTGTYRVGHESDTNVKDYDKIKMHCEKDIVMVSYLYSLFPNLGDYDKEYFNNIVWHRLLYAAYHNNDFKNAKIFGKKSPIRNKYTICSQYWISFQLARLYKKYWKK